MGELKGLGCSSREAGGWCGERRGLGRGCRTGVLFKGLGDDGCYERDRGVWGAVEGAMGAGRGVLQGVGCHRGVVGVLQMSWGCCRRDGGDEGCGRDPRVFWGLELVGAGTMLGVLQTRRGGGEAWGCCC